MAALSKSLEETIRWRSCQELLHPRSCRRAALENVCRFAWSNSKYYLPVVLLHLGKHGILSGGGWLSLNLLLDSLWYYAQLVLGGVANASLISISMCSLRNLLGKFHLYTLLFIPAAIGGSICACFPRRVKHLQHTAIFQSLIESLLLHSNPLARAVTRSLPLQSLIFMCCSAVILEGKQKRWGHSGFWFLTPDAAPTVDDLPGKGCTHPELDCRLYVVRGIRNYLMIGLALDLFRAIISCTKAGEWRLRHLSLQSTAWLGCYVGIYRAVLCYLRHGPVVKDSSRHLWAGFLGGLSYLLYPKPTILSYAMLEAIRTLWARHQGSKKDSKKRHGYGYGDLAFPVALAYLIHNYVLQSQRVSGLSGVIIDNTTANYALNIRKRLARLC
ncbi:transmembrane protein 135-like [Drosophila miranda]|uniref:transmembrane protein 135-like n=1 Tax=Drosophila miranda TaxID=7229 RepID=UPI0007E87CE9|nr:transmembrane protein 135-like [Drosophila miranda]